MKSLLSYLFTAYLLHCGTTHAQDLIKVGFQETLTEVNNEDCTVTEGSIPEWLEGYFLRQSCGSFGNLTESDPANYTTIQHLFDCLGMVTSFQLSDGDTPKYSARYFDVKSYNIWKEYDQDLSRSRVAWDTTFTDIDITQHANWSGTFQDKYGSQPTVSFWDLDPEDVEVHAVTEAPSVYGLSLETLEQLSPVNPFTDNIGQPQGTILVEVPAHEQVGQDGTFYSTVGAINFNSQTTGTARQLVYKIENKTRIPVGSYDMGTFDLTSCTGYPVEYPDLASRVPYMHSFALTENYIILPLTSYLLDYCQLLVYDAIQPTPFFKDSYSFKSDQKSRVLIMNRTDGEFVADIETDAFFSTHQFGAFERDGSIIFDMITYSDDSIYTQYTATSSLLSSALWNTDIERFTITMSNLTLTRRTISTVTNGEFSSKNEAYNGLEYNYGYMVSGVWTEAVPGKIIKLEMETGSQVAQWEAPESHFPQEPIFVARPEATAEDDGILLVSGFNANTKLGFMVVLDATDLTKIAEVSAPQLTPIGIHNRFYARSTDTSSATCTQMNLVAAIAIVSTILYNIYSV